MYPSPPPPDGTDEMAAPLQPARKRLSAQQAPPPGGNADSGPGGLNTHGSPTVGRSRPTAGGRWCVSFQPIGRGDRFLVRFAARLALIVACAAAVLAAAASVQARAAGRLQLGVLGSPGRFDRQTGQRSTTRLIIVGIGQGSGSPDYFTDQLFSAMLDTPMIGLSTGSEGRPETLTPAQVAHGQGDAFLVALNRAIATWHGQVYVRPFAEMNGHWNAYCAYNADGSSRGPSHSTAAFKKAFARIYLIVHGAVGASSRLASLGLPPVAGTVTPAPNARVIWNPQGYGSPDLPGNSAQAYYPGDRYVDVVGDDLYDIRGKAEWAATDALYKAHPSKPFSIPEWGLWGLDDPSFVSQMAAFLKSHPRTVLASYYSGAAGSIFDLATKPRSRAAYRSMITPLGG
jgi:hypothetical protein